jgi:plastocyanin
MRRYQAFPVLPVALLALVSCGGGAPAPAAAPAGRRVDPATAGTIAGRVVYTGTVPAPDRLRMHTDPACVTAAGPSPASEAIVVAADGGVKNAYVHITNGLDASYTFDLPATEVFLDQKGCVYVPRVAGVRVGQPITIANSDPTLHNVHAIPMINAEFNHGQPTQGMKNTKTFSAPEVMVPFKCNVHAWMTAYVGVSSHPYFAVTPESGAFSIGNVPPGTYTIEAWHEAFGTEKATVTVGEKQSQAITLTFETIAGGK